jgi:TP901 family phage tail tape measure protein
MANDAVVTLRAIITGDNASAIKALTGTAEAAEKSSDDISSSSGSMGSKLNGIFSKVGEAGVAGIAAVAVASIDLASKYQASTASIAANAGISEAAAQKISNAFLTTAGTTIYSAQQIDTAYAGVAGQLTEINGKALTSGQALTYMKTCMDLAEASGESLTAATADVTNILQAYGMGVTQAGEVTNVLFNTANKTGVSIDTETASLTKLKATLGAAAPSLRDVAGLQLDLANNGESGRKGLAAISTATTGLISPTTAAATAQQQLGLNVRNASGTFVGYGSIITQLQPILAGHSQAQQLAILKSIGMGSANIKLLDTINAGPAAYNKDTAAVGKANSAHAAAEKQAQTFSHQIELLTATLKDEGIKIGDVLLPKLEELGKKVAATVDWFTKHKKIAEDLGIVIGGVLAAAIGVYIGGMIISAVQTGIAAAQTLLFGEAQVVAAAAADGATAAAIAAGAAAEESSLVQVAGAIRSVISMIPVVAGYVVTAVSATAMGIAAAAAWLMALGPVGLVIAAIAGIIAIFVVVAIKVKAVRDVFKDAFGVIVTIVKLCIDLVKAEIKSVLDVIIGIVKVFIDVFTGNWTGAWNAIQAVFTQVWNAISGAFSAVAGTLEKVGKDLIQGLVNGIKEAADLPVKAIKAVAKGVIDVVKDVLGIFSPSKVMHDVGKNTVQGLQEGIKENAKLATDEMKSLKLAESLVPELNKVKNAAKQVAPDLEEIGKALLIIAVDGTMAQGGVKIASKAIEQIGDALKHVGNTPKQFGDDLSALATLATKLQPGPITKAIEAIVVGFKMIAAADLTPAADKDTKALEKLGAGMKPADAALKVMAVNTKAAAAEFTKGATETEKIASSLTKAESQGSKLNHTLDQMAHSLLAMKTAVTASAHELSSGLITALTADEAAARKIKPAFDGVASSVDASSKKVENTVDDWKKFDKEIQIVLGTVKNLSTVITDIANSMKSTSTSAQKTEDDFKSLGDIIDSVGQRIKTILIMVKSQGLDPLDHTVTSLKTDWTAAWQGMGTTAGTQETSISTACTSIGTSVNNLSTAVTAEEGSWNSAWSNLSSDVTTAFPNSGNALNSVGSNLVQGFINGMNSQSGNASTAIGQIVTNAINAAKAAAGIKSPSTVMHEMGENFMKGLANGVTDNAGLATGAVSAVASSMAATKFGVPSLNIGAAGVPTTGSTPGAAGGFGASAPITNALTGGGTTTIEINGFNLSDPNATAAEIGWLMRTAATV